MGVSAPVAGSLAPVWASINSQPVSVAVDPTGKFAYVTNLGSNNVSGYTIDPMTGALTVISGSPFAAGSRPFSVAVARLH
jgi:DNA-binding beta-propeller fold protein YncE